MADEPMSHYEKQLYSVFKTFDVDNEESLDKSAVLDLCESLQLEDRGAALSDALFDSGDARVSFAQFRNGLLSVLGAEPAAAAPPPASDDDSSGREVEPRFVVGAKKYGRRSRPERSGDEGPSPRAQSDSRLSNRCRDRRAREEPDGAAPPEHDARLDRTRALALCRALRMDGIDARTVERVFQGCGTPDTTVGEFFDRLNALLSGSIAAQRDLGSSGSDDGDASDAEPSDRVAELWGRAGVPRPRRLLAELGLPAPPAALRPRDAQRALDVELRGAAPAPGAALAAAALARMRLRRSRARAAAARAERTKLRADLAEADRRAQLIAQEVDESQARLEAELRDTVRRADARLTEGARAAAAGLAAERERAAEREASLVAEAARRADAETRLREEAAGLRARCAELEAAVERAEERAAKAEAGAARTAEEARAAAGGAADAAPAALEAQARAARALRAERDALRDRCDELQAALEAAQRPEKPESPTPQPLAETLADCGGGAAREGQGVEGDDQEKALLRELVAELEAQLSAAQADVAASEEYWREELQAERARRAAPLAPLHETPLDAQMEQAERELAELRAEAESIREQRARECERDRASRAELAERDRQIAALQATVHELEAKTEPRARTRRAPRAPAPRPAPPPAHCDCGRAAALAARVSRLAARLAAADLLVADLYLDNCRLARRAPRRPL